MSVDTWLVSQLKSIPGINRVYHIENYNIDDIANKFPACVYMLRENQPELELSGISGFHMTLYECYLVDKSSEYIRNIACLIKEWNAETFNESIDDPFVHWIEVIDDIETNEFSAEHEAKGYKVSTLLIQIRNETGGL